MRLNTLLRITGNEYEYIFNENHVLKRSEKWEIIRIMKGILKRWTRRRIREEE